jgi:hypothetical protein
VRASTPPCGAGGAALSSAAASPSSAVSPSSTAGRLEHVLRAGLALRLLLVDLVLERVRVGLRRGGGLLARDEHAGDGLVAGAALQPQQQLHRRRPGRRANGLRLLRRRLGPVAALPLRHRHRERASQGRKRPSTPNAD